MKKTRIEQLKYNKKISKICKLIGVSFLFSSLVIGSSYSIADTEINEEIETTVEESQITSESIIETEITQISTENELDVLENSDENYENPIPTNETLSTRTGTLAVESFEIVGNDFPIYGVPELYNVVATIEYYGNGMLVDTIQLVHEIDGVNYELVSSNPDDVVSNGTVTFYSNGMRTLTVSKIGTTENYTKNVSVIGEETPYAWWNIDWSEAQSVYTQYTLLIESEYTADSWAQMQKVFATPIYKNSTYWNTLEYWLEEDLSKELTVKEFEVLQEQINIIVPALREALNSLIKVTPYKVSDLNLEQAEIFVNQYYSLIESEYTPESWAQMKEALLAPQSGYTYIYHLEYWLNYNSSEEELSTHWFEIYQKNIDSYVNSVKDAINLLVPISSEITNEIADITISRETENRSNDINNSDTLAGSGEKNSNDNKNDLPETGEKKNYIYILSGVFTTIIVIGLWIESKSEISKI